MGKFRDWITDKIMTTVGVVYTGEEPVLLEDTVWEDKAYPLVGRRLSSNAGTVDTDWEEQAVSFSSDGDITDTNDLVGLNAEHPHSADENGIIYPHLHFWQPADLPYVFKLDYRIQNNGQAKTTAWNRMTAEVATDSVFPFTTANQNQIVYFYNPDTGSGRTRGIDMTGTSLSATIQIRLTRTDSETGVVQATFFDIHWSRKRLGSRSEGVL